MYYVGIDFGHGETTVSRVPGYDGELVSQIKLRDTTKAHCKKITSALCKKNGVWSFVCGEQDYGYDDLREGFKAMVRCNNHQMQARVMSDRDKESMREFAKLVFKAFLDHDSDLEYDSNTMNKNFMLGIACPSNWCNLDNHAQSDYMQFFREECGLPVDICIKESDAAFFSKFRNYNEDDCVFVIDLGSSTIDFTTYHNAKCIKDLCWGEDAGAHRIDDLLQKWIANTDDYRTNIQRVIDVRQQNNYVGDIRSSLNLFIRDAKENYYTDEQEFYTLFIRSTLLTNHWPGKPMDMCVGESIKSNDYDQIISAYKLRLENALNNAKIKLSQQGITPNCVLLSGGACCMPFVREFTRNIFKEAHLDIDQKPECIVSNGIALYAKSLNDVIPTPPNENYFADLYIRANKYATLEVIKELFPNVLQKIEGDKDLTGEEMHKRILTFFLHLNNHQRYKEITSAEINRFINVNAYSLIHDALKDKFHVEIDRTDVNIKVEVQAMTFNPMFVQVFHELDDILKDATGPHWFTDYDKDKERSISERRRVAELCRQRLYTEYLFDVLFEPKDFRNIAQKIKEQYISEVKRIIYSKQLFETTFQ